MNFNGLTYQQILDYAAGALAPDAAADVAPRIESSVEAMKVVALYRSVALTVLGDDSCPPSPAALRAACAVFDPQRLSAPAAGEGWWNTLERIVASMLFDSRLQSAGVRSGDPSVFTLSYGIEGADLDLQVDPVRSTSDTRHERWRMRGQASLEQGTDTAQVIVAHSGSREPLARMQADDRGRFEVEVDAGRYDVYVLTGHTVMMASDVMIP